MKVFNSCCENCLFSSEAIVSPERKKEIIQSCVKDQSYFICHKATMNDEETCCHEYYNKLGHTSQMIKIAERLGVIEFVDQPEAEKLPNFKEIYGKRNNQNKTQ